VCGSCPKGDNRPVNENNKISSVAQTWPNDDKRIMTLVTKEMNSNVTA
jgi:hypothetical protein